MSILTIVLIVLLAWAIYHFLPVILKKDISSSKTRERLKHIKTIGSFALVLGILGQLIGLYEAFGAIQQMGDVSPALLAGGLKVSMITTFYGIFIFLMSLLIWFITDYIAGNRTDTTN